MLINRGKNSHLEIKNELQRNIECQKYSPVEFRKEMHLKIIALKRNHRIVYSSAQAVDNEDKIEIDFRENDILVLVGEIRDIRRFLHE